MLRLGLRGSLNAGLYRAYRPTFTHESWIHCVRRCQSTVQSRLIAGNGATVLLTRNGSWSRRLDTHSRRLLSGSPSAKSDVIKQASSKLQDPKTSSPVPGSNDGSIAPRTDVTSPTDPQKEPWGPRMWRKIKEGAHHYWVGTKLLGTEIRISTGLCTRLLKGHQLTRREHRQVRFCFPLMPITHSCVAAPNDGRHVPSCSLHYHSDCTIPRVCPAFPSEALPTHASEHVRRRPSKGTCLMSNIVSFGDSNQVSASRRSRKSGN